MSVLASAVAWILFYFALRRLPAGIASMGTLATPVIGVAAAWLQFGERPSALEGSGMALICAGLLLLALPPEWLGRASPVPRG
jgi:drug/metabolite transporter (DMT)-like permease